MLGFIAILIAAAVGWIMNIIKVFWSMGGDIDAELIIRIVGIPIAFIGAVAGYL
jgi:hypothetical protein